jgi:PAS domain S-box-containing protein
LGYIKFWNRGAEELYGWSREEALGRTTHELIRTQFPVPLPEIVRQTREENRWQGELVHTAKNGRQITVLSRWGLLPTTDGSGAPDLMETNTDITGRKQDEEQIRKQREWLHTTLTSIGDAVIATDPEGRITLMNPVAEKLTEWKSEEAVGKPLTDVFQIVNQETRTPVENPVEKVRRLNHVVGLANHTVLISKSGQDFAIDDSGAPIRDSNGRIAGIVLIFRDVTQQRALEVALRSNERLALAGRLSASIAHEIHNPLDTVANALFLLDEQIGTETKARQLIETAQREIHRVAEISKNMLSLHRESRAASRVKLSELLDGVVTLVQETIAKDRRKIDLFHGFEGEIEAFGSELRQVFTNVLKNAVEATTDGGNIKIYSDAAAQSGQNGVMIRVVDDGVGIPEQVQSRLFSPFVSTKEDRNTRLKL